MIATGIVPAAMEMMDRACVAAVEASIYAAGYPTDAAAVLLVELDGQADAVEAEAATVEALLRERGARTVRSASSAADRARLWQGRKKAFGAMGRIAPDLAVQDAVVPRSALPDIMDRIAEIRDRHGISISNVFHAGDGNLHPNISFDRRDPDARAAGARGLHARSWRPASTAGGSITGEHGVGSDKLDYMPWIFDAETLGAMRAVRRVFDPAERANPGKVVPLHACREWRAAPAARAPDERRRPRPPPRAARHQRRRARPDGLPRAIPDTADALSLVCRLAHEEGWKIRVEGQGTWLPADAPADLAVSTRALDQVVSVSPADLVATVQAGTPLEALRRASGRRGHVARARPAGPARAHASARSSPPPPPARCGTGSARCAITCSAAPWPPATAGWSRPAAGW